MNKMFLLGAILLIGCSPTKPIYEADSECSLSFQCGYLIGASDTRDYFLEIMSKKKYYEFNIDSLKKIRLIEFIKQLEGDK
jgi:hypothetical protein